MKRRILVLPARRRSAGSNSGQMRELVAPNYLNLDLCTFSRAQVGSISTAFGPSGTVLQGYNADTPRFNNVDRQLLIEGQRTNLSTNPRGEGLVAGTPGTRPTGWGSLPSGASSQLIGFSTRNGITGILVRFFGTPSTTGGQQWQVGGTSDVVSVGTTVSNSIFVALDAGTLSNVSVFDLRSGISEAGGTSFTPSSTVAYLKNTRTTTGTLSSTTMRWTYLDTVTPVDFTLFIGWPGREHAPFSSLPILPAVGSPAASTRGADILTASLSALGIGGNGECTIYGTAMIPQAAPAGNDQVIAQIDGGSDANRFRIVNWAGGSVISGGYVVGGTPTNAATAGTMTPGTQFSFGASISGGRIAISVNGAAPAVVAGGPTIDMTTLRIGNNAAGVSSISGEIGVFRVLPAALSDDGLQSLVGGLT